MWKSNNGSRTMKARYLDRFFALNSCEDMTRLRLFPNAKEVTESFAMLDAVERFCGLDPKSPTVRVFVVGDGRKPRTGALFAFMTRWEIYSIDPDMKGDFSEVRNLTQIPKKIEHAEIVFPPDDKTHIIILPHSHAPIDTSYKKLKNDRTWVITMPCCVEHSLALPGLVYRDEFVGSPKNEIKVYSNFKTPEFV